VHSEYSDNKVVETSLVIYHSTQRNRLDEFNLHQRHSENLLISQINTAERMSSSRKSTTLSESAHLVNQHGSKNLHISHIIAVVRISKSHISPPLPEFRNVTTHNDRSTKQLWQESRKCTSELQGRATSHGPYSAIRLERGVFVFSRRTESFSEVISFPFSNYIYNIHK